MAELCARFDDLIVASMNSATLLAGRLKPGHLFDAKGAGFTRYSAVHAELYEMSKRQCLSATKSKPPRTVGYQLVGSWDSARGVAASRLVAFVAC